MADRKVSDAAPGTGGSPEDVVFARLRSALPRAVGLYRNVRWIAAPEDGAAGRSPNADGETDILLVDPERGILVVEVKGGTVSVDGYGRWYAGARALETAPFEQAERGKHRLTKLLSSDPDWVGDPPVSGHAVAFPDVDWATAGPGVRSLGADAPRAICMDAEDLASNASARDAVEGLWAFWLGASAGRPIPARNLAVVERAVVRPVELRPLLRRSMERGEQDVRVMTKHQVRVLNGLAAARRVAVAGGAGTGKTQLAVEKARQLARDGYRTLLVCFNQPLARAFRDEEALAELIAAGRLEACTFHELARRLETVAGTLPAEPGSQDGPVDRRAWFDAIADGFLEAVERVPDRYHAIVVDEGQDFDRAWLEGLPWLLDDPEDDVLYVFHDPGQALYREDQVDALGLFSYVLQEDCRNPAEIHALAARFRGDAPTSEPLREGPSGSVRIVEAEAGAATVDAVRQELHRIVTEGNVPPWDVVVLVGVALARSDVWRARRLGNDVLWNGGVDEAGRSRGLAADDVPDQPSDTILCETIHRFKGLDEKVVILAELRPDDRRLDRLLYVGISRAREHLAVVALPAVAERLR